MRDRDRWDHSHLHTRCLPRGPGVWLHLFAGRVSAGALRIRSWQRGYLSVGCLSVWRVGHAKAVDEMRKESQGRAGKRRAWIPVALEMGSWGRPGDWQKAPYPENRDKKRREAAKGILGIQPG